MNPIRVNALIFGGGATGLWLLDALRRTGRSAILVEAEHLGSGQTIASQGILHGGLKYSLQGLLTAAAREARDMPALWRQCLAGAGTPDLSRVEVRSESFHLWGTDSTSSRLGMFGARLGLCATPVGITGADRPQLLRGCAGSVYQVHEQVVSPASLLANLAAPHWESILQVDRDSVQFECDGPGQVNTVQFRSPGGNLSVLVEPERVVFAAGNGNAELRAAVGLKPAAMQRRPLHMVLARGSLPDFYGHCIDGARTRVSITSARDSRGRTIWQLGGQLAEDGVPLDAAGLIQRAHRELSATLPALDLRGSEWSAYRSDRAEGATSTGGRPDSYRLVQKGNILTAWPTKLVLVPQLAAAMLPIFLSSAPLNPNLSESLGNWPRPHVASPPWERCQNWIRFNEDRRAAA